jgi:hypothetical protein
MATVASVYTIAPYVRTPEEILSRMQGPHAPDLRRPKPHDKRVWASLEKEPEQVIAAMMAEAERRDPDGRKTWVGVVDGNRSQRDLLQREARRRRVRLVIVLDIVHVIEYVWKAAWAFFEKGTKEAEAWVGERVLEILRGRGGQVAGGMRRSATLRGLDEKQREAVEACASYLLNNRRRIGYDEYLAAGYPIASGVIEGACRHLVGDRLEITGARWGLPTAEAVLRLRSLRSSGDFDEYWAFHLGRELERNRTMDYAEGIIPKPATPARRCASRRAGDYAEYKEPHPCQFARRNLGQNLGCSHFQSPFPVPISTKGTSLAERATGLRIFYEILSPSLCPEGYRIRC